jgi:hypothetical protein
MCITNDLNIPADNNLYISTYTPLIWGAKRYTPSADVSNYSFAVPYSFDLGQWGTINSVSDYTITDNSLHTGSIIVISVDNKQLAIPGSDAFPLLNTLQYSDVVVTLPWRSYDFNIVVTSSTFKCTHTGALTWHPSYLHSKDSTHVFAVKQREVGGGIESNENEVADKVPFRLFEQGKVLDGVNNITSQGIMAHGIIPQLGGQFLCWSPFPTDFTG